MITPSVAAIEAAWSNRIDIPFAKLGVSLMSIKSEFEKSKPFNLLSVKSASCKLHLRKSTLLKLTLWKIPLLIDYPQNKPVLTY